MRWSKVVIENKGKRLAIFVSGDYQVCADIRKFEDGDPTEEWLFGVYYKKRWVTQRETLEAAKRAASLHAELGDDV